MLRHAAKCLLRQKGCRLHEGVRGLTTSRLALAEGDAPASTSTFSAEGADPESFKKEFAKYASSTMAPPHFPSDFLPKQDKAGDKEQQAVPDKLTFSFYLPHEQIAQKAKVDLVLLPAVTGDFGAMPGHVPTVAQLRPGVVTVHKELDKTVDKYFVSSGYAFIHADSSADLVAVEAFKLDELDPDAVRAGLQEYTAKLASLQGKSDDFEIAAAQIGVEVYSAMNSAIG